jgi:hypothetical protein
MGNVDDKWHLRANSGGQLWGKNDSMWLSLPERLHHQSSSSDGRQGQTPFPGATFNMDDIQSVACLE